MGFGTLGVSRVSMCEFLRLVPDVIHEPFYNPSRVAKVLAEAALPNTVSTLSRMGGQNPGPRAIVGERRRLTRR